MKRLLRGRHQEIMAITVALIFCGCASVEQIHIQTDPPGASVSVNGGFVGTSPVVYAQTDHSFKQGLPTLTVEAEKDGHPHFRRRSAHGVTGILSAIRREQMILTRASLR